MTSTEPTKVELYYDVVSPYTWLGFEALCRYRAHWNMDLILRPIFLGGVMKASGNKPPMTVESKGLYMHKDLQRNAEYFGVELRPIENPFLVMVEKGTLRAMRFLTAVQLYFPKYLESVSRELWMRIWSRGEDIVEDESLSLAAKHAKMDENDIKKCILAINSVDVKKALKTTTEAAINHGAFGAPTIVVHTKSGPEMFFGSDRFPLIAKMMNESWKGPFPELKSSL